VQWGTPFFSDVWQTKDFKSSEFGSVAGKGVTGDFSEVWQGKGVDANGSTSPVRNEWLMTREDGAGKYCAIFGAGNRE
jgi:hypothetical protein